MSRVRVEYDLIHGAMMTAKSLHQLTFLAGSNIPDTDKAVCRATRHK